LTFDEVITKIRHHVFRCSVDTLKCSDWGYPGLHWGAYSAPRLLARFKGPLDGQGKGNGIEKRRREGGK